MCVCIYNMSHRECVCDLVLVVCSDVCCFKKTCCIVIVLINNNDDNNHNSNKNNIGTCVRTICQANLETPIEFEDLRTYG